MWRLHARKVSNLYGGRPASTIGCNIADDGAVTTNGRKSAKVIVATREGCDGRNK